VVGTAENGENEDAEDPGDDTNQYGGGSQEIDGVRVPQRVVHAFQ
jgi:hypothetical protein